MIPIRRERCDFSRDNMLPAEFKKYVAQQKYVVKRSLVDSGWAYEFEHPDTLTSPVVGHETYKTWKWFLKILLKDLNIERADEYTFISDKQKGLIKAMEKIIRGVEHRFCVWLLYNNFKLLHKGVALKNLLWKAARAATKPKFEEALEEMKAIDAGAYGWLASKPEYRRFVDELIRPLETDFNRFGCLIQFWRAKEGVVNNNSVPLTLRNQPFLLQGLYSSGITVAQLSRYRMKMHDVIVNGDETGRGPIGRVFRNNKMEFTPHVPFYSDNEYPQRDIAKSCRIQSSLVLLWRDYDGCVVGVIEFVSLLELPLLYTLPSDMLRSNSLYSDYCKRLCGQYDSEMDSLISSVTEINEVIGEVCKRRYVVCAQTWMLCKHCYSLSIVKRCGGELKASSENFVDVGYTGSFFLHNQDYYNLKKGEGVVGKAAESSHDLVYCEDVAKLSITEYPLAHFARYCELSASFAIRLKSNQTGDQVYVLEFFLDPDYVKGKNLRATLVPILATMWECFKTLMFASGGEIRSVLVIDANSPDKVKSLETSLQDISMEDALVASSSSVHCELRVTIEAFDGHDFTRFPLSASSGIRELYHQVSQRLQRADTTFYLKYLDDDNDLIELTCDEDLQLYISSSREQEIYTLPVVVVPR